MKSWLVPGLIFIGIILILVALVIPSRTLDSIGKKTLASVTDLNGTVMVQGLDQTDLTPLKKKSMLRNLDLISTQDQSTATLLINSINAEIKILENTKVLLEENSVGKIILNLKIGDLTVENFGDKDSIFWIKKDGRLLSAIDYSITSEQTFNKKNATQSQIILDSKNTGFLSQAKIEEILNNKKSDFFRCYGQLIQKIEQAHGQLLLTFEILPTGKVVSVEFSKSDLNQPYFLSCLKEVVLRTKFPIFNGKSITTVFPLKFE